MSTFKDLIVETSIQKVISRGMSTYMAFRIATLLQKPFEDWDACKAGLISDQGEIIRKPDSNERAMFGPMENMIRKVRRVLMRYVGDSRILNTILALYLVKESRDITEDDKTLIESVSIMINEELDEDEIECLKQFVGKMDL